MFVLLHVLTWTDFPQITQRTVRFSTVTIRLSVTITDMRIMTPKITRITFTKNINNYTKGFGFPLIVPLICVSTFSPGKGVNSLILAISKQFYLCSKGFTYLANLRVRESSLDFFQRISD
jgi:hypothetical protein